MSNEEVSFDFKMTEENKKALNELLNAKKLKHYLLETKDKEKLDLVEYKDYQDLEEQNQKYKEVIDKAINYIEENVYKEENGCGDYWWEIADKKELLDILRGEINEK